jgi:PPK2 family polyphosphate:nucleotide phosphotransferase
MPSDDGTAKLLKRYRVQPGGKGFDLDRIAPDDKAGFTDKVSTEPQFAADVARIDELQEILFAQAKHAVLIVLQGMDTSGKDGVVRHVCGPLDAQGVSVTSFKKPTLPELARDYLWRVHHEVPPRGTIGLFNRSHYEDVLVVKVHDWVPKAQIEQRYQQINDFERYLSENGVTILKFFLHISKDEQKERLQARLDDPTKRWKFERGDIEERRLWDEYQHAYRLVLERCSTAWAPWYVIPADRKWVRNALVARVLRTTLEGLDPRYPDPPPGLDKLEIDG